MVGGEKGKRRKGEESCMGRRQSPRLHMETRKSPRLNVGVSGRRLSPRLNVGVSETRLSPRLNVGVCPPPANSVTQQLETRLSPRLHVVASPPPPPTSIIPLQRRLSPRLHPNPPLTQEDASKDSVFQSRLHPYSSSSSSSSLGKRLRLPVLSNAGLPHKTNKLVPSNLNPPSAAPNLHHRVNDTIRLFLSYYFQFVKEHEETSKKQQINLLKKAKSSKSKKTGSKKTSFRPDLMALTKMIHNNEIMSHEKIVGHIPGVDVGYQFYSRAEMVAVGVHSHWLSGIDYIGISGGEKAKSLQYTFPIAVAVVMSGQYEDDLDNSEDIIYTGQGGHDLLGSKLQCGDQALVRGNLAMKNSMDQSVPIRVFRGQNSAGSYSGKIYSYSGLYKIVKTFPEKGHRGHLIYKYHLKRLGGQPKLTTEQVEFVRGRRAKTTEFTGLVCSDISNGQEAICIPVINTYDNPPVGPAGFTYIKSMEIAKSVKLPPNASGCKCKGNCTNPKICACVKLNGTDFPYVCSHGGRRLAKAKDIVFECGPNCGCGSNCLNRTSQRGIKYNLEVYRTPDKGWAVRTRDYIPQGAPVCEYIGVLGRSDDLDNVAENDYIFEIDCLHTMNEIEGRERRFGNLPVSVTKYLAKIDEKTLDGTPEFSIDAGSKGNVARFINHSCEPNLFVQGILSSHHDLRLARLVLFASDDIPPMQELTYDYGYILDSVVGPDGKVRTLPCFCGTTECRKRLY